MVISCLDYSRDCTRKICYGFLPTTPCPLGRILCISGGLQLIFYEIKVHTGGPSSPRPSLDPFPGSNDLSVVSSENDHDPHAFVQENSVSTGKILQFLQAGGSSVTNLRASDPRDRVYALLSIVDERDSQLIQADYRKEWTVEKSYMNAAEAMLVRTGLGILSFCTYSPREEGFELPSWTPDWREKRYELLEYRSISQSAFVPQTHLNYTRYQDSGRGETVFCQSMVPRLMKFK